MADNALSDISAEEADFVDPDDIPEEQGYQRTPPPAAGVKYVFQLPKDIKGLWKTFDQAKRDANNKVIEIPGEVDDKTGRPKIELVQRLRLAFDDNNPLMIIKALAEAGKPFEGTAFPRYGLDTVPRKRFKPGKRGEFVLVSDLQYLVLAVAPGVKITSNAELKKVLDGKGGAKFEAEAQLQAKCRNDKQAWKFTGNELETAQWYDTDPETNESRPHMGCGQTTWFGKWPKQDGKYPEKIQCKCGASLNGFAVLAMIKPVGK